VADETDFLDLYGKLRLEPGCSLEDFKQAYRRHVAMWHPDRRRRGSRADMLAAARLQRLTAQYGAAMDFHRRHGRLPGAPMVARIVETPPAETQEFGPVAAGQPTPTAETAPARPPQRSLSTRWWLAIVATAVGIAVWSMWPATEPSDVDATEPQAVSHVHENTYAAHATLSLGMTADEVIAIEGEPTRRTEERWEYGPSWVRFENEALADWYSSPLRALHVPSARARP
jgi:hypothetical protein